jgi:hypothetical protein
VYSRVCALAAYRPYPRQAEFHAAGAAHRERLFLGVRRFCA